MHALKLLPTLVLCFLAVYSVYHTHNQQPVFPDTETLFNTWLLQHKKSYSAEQFAYRLAVFAENNNKVAAHNARYSQGLTSYRMELNKFADLTQSEFKALYHYKIPKHRNLKKKTQTQLGATNICLGDIQDTPHPLDEVDWTKKASTPIQNQGQCGSSWAFSTTGAIEGLYAQTKGKLTVMSSQQLVDCSGSYGNEGCNGGIMDQAFWYVIDNGITTNDQYSYTGNSDKCIYKSAMRYYQISKCVDVPSKNYSKLISAVNQQPVSVAVESQNFQLYKDGVFDGDCGDDLDAGMVLLGYGTQDSKPYWRLKNSLGTDWGMSGFILLSRTTTDDFGKCGIQAIPVIPRP